MKAVLFIKAFIASLFVPTVEDAISAVGGAIVKLEKAAEHHISKALDKRDEANTLHAEADAHEEEHLRAVRVQTKLLDLVR